MIVNRSIEPMSAVGRLLICPTTGCFPVQPICKDICASRLTQSSNISIAVPSLRGALAIVTDAERDAVDAGGALDECADADGEVVWSFQGGLKKMLLFEN